MSAVGDVSEDGWCARALGTREASLSATGASDNAVGTENGVTGVD